MVKDPPRLLDRWVQSLGQKDPLETGMATHSLENGGFHRQRTMVGNRP